MYNYDSFAQEAHQRAAEMIKEAQRRQLVTIAQGNTRRFRFTGWRLPVLHQGLLNRKPANNNQTTTRRTVSDNI